MTPELNGYETVKAIREIPEYEKTPILFLTANSSEEAIQQGKDADANGWIVKPFTPEVLVQTVKKVLS
jgi:two-component system chemotaxis response regulator CheY